MDTDTNSKWLPLFESVLNGDRPELLFKLSQMTCKSESHSLWREIRQNQKDFENHNDEDFGKWQQQVIALKIAAKSASSKSEINLNLEGFTDDELLVFEYTTDPQRMDLLMRRVPRSCRWKTFSITLFSAIRNLKRLRYCDTIPETLYCYLFDSNHEDMNRVTVWYDGQWKPSECKQRGVCRIVHLEGANVRKSKDICILPVPLVQQKRERKRYLILPFECVANANSSDLNLFTKVQHQIIDDITKETESGEFYKIDSNVQTRSVAIVFP